jgi:hypothetical protein
MKHALIIDQLTELEGGQARLGKRFKVANSTICHWKEDGIPARHWPLILDIARQHRFRLKLEDIVQHSPLRADRKRKRPYKPRPKARVFSRKPPRDSRGSGATAS